MSVADLSWEVIGLLVVGSALAGFINTLAGNGSAITLTLLTEVIGLPPLLANGTNRVGVMAQCASSFAAYWRGGKINWQKGTRILVPVVLGAIAGGILSTQVSNEAFRSVFKWMLFVILILVFIKPKRWLTPDPKRKPLPNWIFLPLALLVGAYGGFIQMGFGPLYLALIVLCTGMPLAEANVYKIVTVTLYTPILLVSFVLAGQVNWGIGLIMAGAQAVAAYSTTVFAVRSDRAGQVAYIVLIIVVVASCLRMLTS